MNASPISSLWLCECMVNNREDLMILDFNTHYIVNNLTIRGVGRNLYNLSVDRATQTTGKDKDTAKFIGYT